MSTDGNLDYALTRVLARFGERLDEADWRRLEANRDLGLYLAAVRSTAMADWVGGFDAEQHDCHTFEAALRTRWRSYVEAVAIWHPQEWQAWLAWLAWLPTLSLLAQLARPDPAPIWMLADTVYGRIAPGPPAERVAVLSRTALAPLAAALTGHSSVGAAWSAHWQTLKPRADARTEQSLELMLLAMRQHQQQLLRAADSADAPRGELANRLQNLLRLAAGTVIVTVCHLALLALDLERLRGALAYRSLFAERSEVP
jgi:hypothetical protein